jgi:hypothetical protein
MIARCLRPAHLAVLPLLFSPPAHAQVLQDRWPTPAQEKQMQTGPGTTAPSTSAPRVAPAAPAKPVAAVTSSAPRHAEPPRVIVCSGVFGKDSSHLKLAQTYEAQNITYTEVDGPEGSKMMASVLYPKDPKKRLEVLWQNDASRSDLSVISINGQSSWVAPKSIHLGVPLATLEKLNGRPFKLAGFDWDGGGAVRDWMGGAMNTLPGGCLMGMKLAPDPKTPAEVRSQVSGDKDFLSSDSLIRAAKPTVEEITIGYPQ